MSAFSADFSTDFAVDSVPTTPVVSYHSPISAYARSYVRRRATEVMEYTCRIERRSGKAGYDDDTLAHIQAPREVLYEGRCRVWEVTAGGAVVVGDTDVYTQATNLSIPWDTPVVIKRYDEVQILTAPQDSQMVGERFEIATTAKAGELRATRRFEVISMENR